MGVHDDDGATGAPGRTARVNRPLGDEKTYQPVVKVADPAWSRSDLIPYTEGPWRWARDRKHGRVRRYG